MQDAFFLAPGPLGHRSRELHHGLIHDSALLALPLGVLLVQSVSEKNLLLGTFDLLLFTAPAILFEFSNSHYFPMSEILILVLLFLWRNTIC